MHFIINYKNNKETESFIENCLECSNFTNGEESSYETHFVLINNSAISEEDATFSKFLATKSVQVFNYPDNPGYLSGVHRASQFYDLTSYNFVIISNSDLKIENKDFYKSLTDLKMNYSGWGAIAPSVWSDLYNMETNPLYFHRPSAAKINRLAFIYKFYSIAFIYHLLSSVKNFILSLSKNKKRLEIECEVYAPHGCFLILTKVFFTAGGNLDFKSRLYGEEIFLAEQIRNLKLKVFTKPELKITHREKGTQGNSLKRHFLNYKTFEFKKKSAIYIKNIFSNN